MSSLQIKEITNQAGENCLPYAIRLPEVLLPVEINEFVKTSEELACQMHGCVTSYRKSMKLVLIIIGSNMPH